MGEHFSAAAFADRLNRFYAAATEAVVGRDGLIDKLIGDEVMALFFSGFAGPDYRRSTVLAAIDLATAVGDLPVGVAANAGTAFVGNVGSGSVTDFTALGDAVNVTARLQARAEPGEVVVSSELYSLIAAEYPSARSERVDVRGRNEQIDVAILTVSRR
jgi:adenylate cyclase